MNADSLRVNLDYEPQPLKFGTSGRRGAVIDLTQLEVYINALAELEYLQSLPASEGGISRGDPFYFAYDLRPSSTRFVPEQGGRGEIAQAIERAIRDAGMQPVNLGAIPTPALTFFALASHLPRSGFQAWKLSLSTTVPRTEPRRSQVHIARSGCSGTSETEVMAPRSRPASTARKASCSRRMKRPSTPESSR